MSIERLDGPVRCSIYGRICTISSVNIDLFNIHMVGEVELQRVYCVNDDLVLSK